MLHFWPLVILTVRHVLEPSSADKITHSRHSFSWLTLVQFPIVQTPVQDVYHRQAVQPKGAKFYHADFGDYMQKVSVMLPGQHILLLSLLCDFSLVVEHVCRAVCVNVCVRACVRRCVRACVHVCVFVCVCVSLLRLRSSPL